MMEIVTFTFDSADTIRNAREDLVATGIPQEKIFVDDQANRISVKTPKATKPEIVEILKRHSPIQ